MVQLKKIYSIIFSIILLCSVFAGCSSDNQDIKFNDKNIKVASLNSDTDNTTAVSIEETTAEPATTQHTHDFSPANCTNPKTCITCGEIEGEALGHKWNNATCTSPKTCSVCNITEGGLAKHSWIDATCNSPKTCSVCKRTEGSAKGHSWRDATCSSPMTCNVCGKTEGSARNHNYSNGSCTYCYSADPNYSAYSSGGAVWIPTNGGKKYHTRSDCSNMKNPMQVTESEAINQGFTPCKRCH